MKTKLMSENKRTLRGSGSIPWTAEAQCGRRPSSFQKERERIVKWKRAVGGTEGGSDHSPLAVTLSIAGAAEGCQSGVSPDEGCQSGVSRDEDCQSGVSPAGPVHVVKWFPEAAELPRRYRQGSCSPGLQMALRIILPMSFG